MRLFVDNLMSHKLAFTYYSYFDTLNFVCIHLANTGYVQATINKTDPHTNPNHFRLSIGGVWDTSGASIVSASQINIELGLTKLERRYGLKSNS